MINLTNEEEIIEVIANYLEKKKKLKLHGKLLGRISMYMVNRTLRVMLQP